MSNRGPYKSQTLDLLRQRGIPVGRILDVGILSGTPELIKAFPDIPHELFEPVAEFEGQIKTCYASLPYTLHKVAVGEYDGTVKLKTFSKFEGGGISHATMDFGPASEDPNLREVPAIRLDTFVLEHKLKGPFLLKLDIDGHELTALRGAEQILRECSVIIIECSRNFFCDRITAVQAKGFTLLDLTEPCYYDKAFWQCDAVFVRNDLFNQHFKSISSKVEPGLFEVFRG